MWVHQLIASLCGNITRLAELEAENRELRRHYTLRGVRATEVLHEAHTIQLDRPSLMQLSAIVERPETHSP